jgi:arylsulfatase A-like enzyme
MKFSPHRLAGLAACVFAIMLAKCGGFACAQSLERPNVVVILIDDMGWSDLGCYGSEIPTPNVDALAAGGVRFTQFYNTARCSPTRACLLTGLYPHQAGMGYLDNLVRPNSKGTQGRLRDDCVTMAEVLQDAGYFTIMTGKWHLGHFHGTPAASRGFHRSLSAPVGEFYFPNQKQRRPAGVFLYGEKRELDDPELGSDWYGPDLITQWGLKFIDEAIAAGQPFFYYLPHSSVHFPLQVPQADIDRYRGKYLVGWDKLREARHRRQIEMGLVDPKWPLSPLPPDVPPWDTRKPKPKDRFDHIMAIYAAMIERLDQSIGTLVAGLKERGILDNTLIFVMSDNGGNAESGPRGRLEGDHPGGPDSIVFLGQDWATLANTPFRRYKHFTHEGGISTPLIVHWPARVPAERNGKLEHQPGHLVDIMATVVDATGAKYPTEYKGHAIQPMEGVSLMPALAGRPLERPNPIYWEHEGNRAIRRGKWKLVSKYTEPWELYDIEADRTEQHDLVDAYPDVVKKLVAEWEAWAKRSDVDQWTGPPRNDAGAEIRRVNPSSRPRRRQRPASSGAAPAEN